MKTKTKVLLFMLALYQFSGFAQEVKIDQLLTSKVWKIDVDALKPLIMLRMAEMEEMKSMSEYEQKISVKAVIMTIEKMRYHFYNDFNFKIVFNPNTTQSGTYEIIHKTNEIILKTNQEEDKVYKIGTVEENKIHLISTGKNYDLILIPEN
ncbi:hypothetical protein [Flavobacterium sp. TBRC 19031]|uniref:hypothetical protein n=1 Tax=Flavobacterium mekongense TaxID=3379707 RepID=UPI00399BBCC3